MDVKRYYLSECSIHNTSLRVSCSTPDHSSTWSWSEACPTSSDKAPEVVPATRLAAGTTIQVKPILRDSKGWDERHFHPQLRSPEDPTGSCGMVVTLEGLARECIAVALSPQPDFVMGKTYVVHLGAAANTSTVIRRRQSSNTDANAVTFPSPQICSDRKFLSYWIILTYEGYLSVGLGKVPGLCCIGTMDDSIYAQLRTGMDAPRFVGIGNSTFGKHARDLEVRSVRVMNIPHLQTSQQKYRLTGGIPSTQFIHIDGDSTFLPHPDYLDGDSSTPQDHPNKDEVDGADAVLWAEYHKECIKAKARADKFGVEYRVPSPEAFFKYSQAKRLKANPQKGFVTGLDINSPEEQEKARKRMLRFQTNHNLADPTPNLKRKPSDVDISTKHLQEQTKDNAILPVEQAWDNQALLQDFRIDPPTSLYHNNTHSTELDATLVPDKLHLFSIDWAAFKQIRTDDILAHFSDYGPSYVEWLGELSCNIHFEDKYSCTRALLALSQELPSPPPPPSMEIHTSDLDNPVMDPSLNEKPSSPDLGLMGWRFCKSCIQKRNNDRYGRAGTQARFILRVASTLDVLEIKPSIRPTPPPGFTTNCVLGPGSDFPSMRPRAESMDVGANKRRKRFKRQNVMQEEEDDLTHIPLNDEPLGLSRSLKASRASI